VLKALLGLENELESILQRHGIQWQAFLEWQRVPEAVEDGVAALAFAADRAGLDPEQKEAVLGSFLAHIESAATQDDVNEAYLHGLREHRSRLSEKGGARDESAGEADEFRLGSAAPRRTRDGDAVITRKSIDLRRFGLPPLEVLNRGLRAALPTAGELTAEIG